MDEHWPLALPGVEPVRALGTGGFGQVWLARQTDLDRLVAVKVGHRPLASADDRRRFERECRALGRLGGHPNIVEVHTSGFDSGLPYLVLAYIGGGTLADHGPSLDETMLRLVAVQLCQAVEAAHGEKVLHRDLKPENVFLEPGGRVVLGDFGIARLGDGNVTEAVGLSASMAFVAPELLASASPSPAVDIYGIGITIVSAVLGRSPFVTGQESTIEAILTNVSGGRVPDLSPYGISPGFERILRWAMERDPTMRPSSAAELERAIAALPTLDTSTVSVPTGGDQAPSTVLIPSSPSPPPGLAGTQPPVGMPPSQTVSDGGSGGTSWPLVGAGVAAVAAIVALVAGLSMLRGPGGESADLGSETDDVGVSVPDVEVPEVAAPEVEVPVVDPVDDTVQDGEVAEPEESTTVPLPPLVLPLNGPEISNLTDIPQDENGVDPLLGPADSPQFCDERPDITGLVDTLAGIYPIDATTDASLRQTAQRMHRFDTEEQAIAFLDSYTGFQCQEWEDAELVAGGITVLTAETVPTSLDLGDEVREVDQRAMTPVGIDLLSRTTLIRQGADVLKLFYQTVRPGELGPVTDELARIAAENLGY